jgi:hypothetical protein
MPNKWIEHIRAYRNKHPSLSYKEALQKGRASYKPVAKGRGLVGGKMKGKGLVGGKVKKAPKKGKGLVGGAVKRKRGRPKKGSGLVGGDIFSDIISGIGDVAKTVAPFVPLLL